MLLHGGFNPGASRISFGGTYLDDTSKTIYTFPDCDIGDAEPGRIVVVPAFIGVDTPGVDDIYINAVSVGGIAADYYLYHDYTDLAVEVWLVKVPSGALADVVVEASGPVDRCEIGVMSFYNMDLNTYDYPASVSTTSFTMPMFEAGGAVVTVPGVQTFTGMDDSAQGTYLSIAWKLATGKDNAHPYTISTATTFGYPYGGLSIGP